MLNFFLVLGLIPGTDIQLTFNEILLIFAGLAGGLWLRARRGQRVVIKQEVIQLSRLHSFSYPIQLSRLEESIGHTAAALPKDIVFRYLSRVARRVHRVA